jgi:sugar lactone lactonase YvrE
VKPAAFVALIVVASHLATAQATATGIASLDSANAARSAWARAGLALQTRDLAAARMDVDRAARAWPVQPAYVWASAVLAARAGDTTRVIDALTSYADLGLGRVVRNDSALRAYARVRRVAPIVARLESNVTALRTSRVVARANDSTLWPEGMDHDPRTGKFYVASVRHRTILEIEPLSGAARELWPRDRDDLVSVLGVRVDTARHVLWATMSTVSYAGDDTTNPRAALLRVRLPDGVIERRWSIAPSRMGHTLGDLGVGPRGDVFVTDSDEPVLYRLRPGADTLERLTHPLFHSLQGVAPTMDGRTLYLADYAIGLLRMDLSTGKVIRLDDAPHTTSLGCDGIALDRGAIVAVQNGVYPPRVVRFVLDVSGTQIRKVEVLDRNVTVADEPTIGAIVGREFVYIANSQWEKHTATGALVPGARLHRPVLLAVPLPP